MCEDDEEGGDLQGRFFVLTFGSFLESNFCSEILMKCCSVLAQIRSADVFRGRLAT